jgi:hypothetical protein
MLTTKFRHWAVALGLVAVAGVTGASAAGVVHRSAAAFTRTGLPVPSGDLGEIVVTAPRDLPEVIVTVHREPVEGELLAHVIVTVPRERADLYTQATEAAATLASVR